jgi:hypothetical protein
LLEIKAHEIMMDGWMHGSMSCMYVMDDVWLLCHGSMNVCVAVWVDGWMDDCCACMYGMIAVGGWMCGCVDGMVWWMDV